MSNRLALLRQRATDCAADGVLLSDPRELRWACGFTGSAGLLFVDGEIGRFVTDGRYRDQAAREVSGAEVTVVSDSLISGLSSLACVRDGSTVAFSSDRTTVGALETYRSTFPDVAWRPVPGLLDQSRARKESDEVAAITRAQTITDTVFDEVLGVMRPEMTELDVAAELVYRCLKHGAERMAFEPIVASGVNGSLPHARPGKKPVGRGEAVVIDFGCVVDGYASDMTRTIALGSASAELRKVHGAVVDAVNAAVNAVRVGVPAAEVDRAARDLLAAEGYGAYFTHSTGHGVGLDVHEWPRLGRTSTDILSEDYVVTIEPGVYLPGRFGVRVEDLVLVGPISPHILTRSPRDLLIV